MDREEERQRGDVLIYALIALTLGVLLVVPILRFVASRSRQTAAYEQVLDEQYAADAGVEYVVWQVENDSELRQRLDDNPGQVYTLTMESVNDVVPALEVVRVEPRKWEYAIWVSDTLNIAGNSSVIKGDVHSNGEINISGNNTVITGSVTYSDTFVGTFENADGTAGTAHQTGEQPVAGAWALEDFQPGGEWALAAENDPDPTIGYYPHSGIFDVDAHDDLPPGLHYVDGDVTFSKNIAEAWHQVTVVASGHITFTQQGNSLEFTDPYVPGLSFFANTAEEPAIYVDANSLTTARLETPGGFFYAPNGSITLDGNNVVSVEGGFLCKSLNVTKNKLVVDLSGGGVPNVPFFMGPVRYDIRSTAEGRATTARLEEQEDGVLQVIAWDVE